MSLTNLAGSNTRLGNYIARQPKRFSFGF